MNKSNSHNNSTKFNTGSIKAMICLPKAWPICLNQVHYLSNVVRCLYKCVADRHRHCQWNVELETEGSRVDWVTRDCWMMCRCRCKINALKDRDMNEMKWKNREALLCPSQPCQKKPQPQIDFIFDHEGLRDLRPTWVNCMNVQCS